MKCSVIAAAGFVLVAASSLASAAEIGPIAAPGAYGRIPVGGYEQPPLSTTEQPIVAIAAAVLGAMVGQPGYAAQGYGQPVYAQPGYGQPVMAQPVYAQPVYVAPPVAPVYMWVPPYQRDNWARYCNQYGACRTPVFFVQDRWYQEHVMNAAYRNGVQRSWNQQQVMEQDRLARERWDRARWEQQRAQQQVHWQQNQNQNRQPGPSGQSEHWQGGNWGR